MLGERRLDGLNRFRLLGNWRRFLLRFRCFNDLLRNRLDSLFFNGLERRGCRFGFQRLNRLFDRLPWLNFRMHHLHGLLRRNPVHHSIGGRLNRPTGDWRRWLDGRGRRFGWNRRGFRRWLECGIR